MATSTHITPWMLLSMAQGLLGHRRPEHGP